MIRWFIAVAALALSSGALAQEKTFTLTVTNQDLQVLSAGLDGLTYKMAQPLVDKLRAQLSQQIQAAPIPAPSPSPAAAPTAEAPKPSNPHPSF